LQRVLDLVATSDHPLVIFVDDLDRCAPGTVVQVIEAINLFLAGEYPNSIFVIAMEPEMVAAHVSAAYSDLVSQLAGRDGPGGRSEDLGWRFLEKIVQLPLTLPSLEPQVRDDFLRSLFSQARIDTATMPIPTEQEVVLAEARIAQGSVAETISSAREEAGQHSKEALREAVRRVIEQQLRADSPEVREALIYATKYLEPNPREIKRFVNIFRFLAMISTERQMADLPAPLSLKHLAKLAVLSVRWPSFLGPLGRQQLQADGRTVFEILEHPPQTPPKQGETQSAEDIGPLTKVLQGVGLSGSSIDRLLSPGFLQFMMSEPVVGRAARSFL
jgi:hypothetical protein